MYSSKEHEADKIEYASRTLKVLRKIRGSVFRENTAPNKVIKADLALSDAEKLGQATARYLIDPLITGDDSVQQNDLVSILDNLELKYNPYWALSCYGSFSPSTFKSSLGARLDLFRINLKDKDTSDNAKVWSMLMCSCNKARMPDLDIFSSDLGIISPLSTDYLYTALLERFITVYTDYDCFKLKPLIIDKGRSVNPKEILKQKDEQFSRNIKEIAIWTDIDSSLDTRRAATQAARILYPGKHIHGAIPNNQL
ncbi:MAG: hypothetical protein WCV81_03135 [Microgenomates group bacterium]|jgi:hypothetical protein